MTNTWVHGVEVNFCNATSVLNSECLQDPLIAKKVKPSDDLVAGCGNGQRDGAVTNDLTVSLEDHVSRAEKLATWEPDCDGVSDEGSYPSVASSGSTDTDAGEWSYAEEYEHCRGHAVDLGVSGGSVASFDTGSFESCDVAEDAGPLAGSKLMPCGGGTNGVDKLSYGLELQHDGGGEFFDTEESPLWARPSPSQCSPSISPQKNVRNSEGSANVPRQRSLVGLSKDPCRPISQEMLLYCSEDVVPSGHLSRNEESPSETGESPLEQKLGPGKVAMADANGTSSSWMGGCGEGYKTVDTGWSLSNLRSGSDCAASTLLFGESSYASFLQPNEHTIKSCRRGDADAAFRDLEAGLETSSHSLNSDRRKVQERGFYDKDLVADLLTSGSLLNHASGNEFGKILLSHIPEHDLNVSKDTSYQIDSRSNGHVAEREDGEVSGLRRRRSGRVSADVEGAKEVQQVDNNGSLKDGTSENGHDLRKSEKKGSAKQIKPRLTTSEKEAPSMASVKSVSGVRRASSETPSSEETRAKEQAENDRKVQESLDNFIRQTMGREPYMSFPGRGDRCLPRLHRPEVLDPLIASKISKGVKLDGGLDMRDNGAEDGLGNTADLDSFRESTSGSIKAGLGRGLPISGDRMNPLKVPQAVMAFAQAAAKASDQLPGWPLMSPSPKVQLQKCQKCSREFCSVINYRRHNRTHKKIFDSDKEDWSKERPKIGVFWERLSPQDGQALLKSLMSEDLDDYSGVKVVKSLSTFAQQATLLSLPTAYQKAGVALLGVVQSSSQDLNLSAEKLFSILDDVSERTFLIGSTDPKDQKVFAGDERIGLEDKNLVSFLGFLLEQKLMKAWMKDEDEQALECQKRLVAEEEAAQKKLAKMQEKKRMKKAKKGLKERERKENAAMLPETETQLLDNTGIVDGVGLLEGSPRSGPSSVGSSAEITELTGHFYRKDDEEVSASQADPVPNDGMLEEVEIAELETKPLLEGRIVEEASGGGTGILYQSDPMEVVLPKDTHLLEERELVADDTCDEFGDKLGPVQLDLEAGPRTQRFDQEKTTTDFKRREGDRNFTDRKFGRASRPRTEFNEGMGSGYGSRRGSDNRFWETPGQGVFKPIRKPSTGPMPVGRADSGTPLAPEAAHMRPQHFRTKSGGRSAIPTGSGQHSVWTVKANQPAASEQKDKKDDEDTNNENALSKSSSGEKLSGKKDAVSATELASPVLAPQKDDKEVVVYDRKETSIAAIVREDMSSIPVASAPSTAFNLDVNPGDWPRLPQKACNQVVAVPTNESSSQGVSPVQAKGISLPAVAVSDSSQVDDTPSQAFLGRSENQQPEAMSGALLVGSLTVPLGNFGTDSGFPPNQRALSTESPVRVPLHSGLAGIVGSGSTASEAVSTSELDGFVENSEDVAGYQKGVLARSYVTANTSSKHFRPHERGENTGMPLSGHERLAKQGSWPIGANRFGTAKVWRAVGVVGDRQEPSNTGLVLGSATFPTSRDVHDKQEGSELLEAVSALSEDLEVSVSSTGGSPQQFRPRPLLVVDDRVRDYVAMLSEFNRIRWEAAQNDPEAYRDMEAAEYQVEETEKVDFLEVVMEAEKAWLNSTAGDQAQCLNEPASVATCDVSMPQYEPEQAMPDTDEEHQSQVSGCEGCIDDTSTSDSQQVTDVSVTSQEEERSTSCSGTAAQGPTEGTDSLREGSNCAVSGSAGVLHGRGSSRPEKWSSQNQKERPPDSAAGLRYIARRR